MQVTIKLGGELRRYAPGDDGIRIIETETPITVAGAVAKLGLEEDADEVLVIVNDQVVPPSERTQFKLKDDDHLTLIPQLKGG